MKKLSLYALVAAGCLAAATAFAQHKDAPAGAPPHGERPAEHAAKQADKEGAAGAEHAEAAEHDEGHHGPAPINWTDIFDKSRPAYIALVINFAILLAIYYAMGKKGVTEGLKQRRIDIGKDIDDARKMLEEAKERAKKYQGDLKNADVDAATAKASLVGSGKGEVEHMLADAQEKSERMKRDADRLVDQERKQLEQEMLRETIEQAVKSAHKILEKQATSEDHARLAQELLAELARKPAAPRIGASPSVRPPTTPVSGGAS